MLDALYKPVFQTGYVTQDLEQATRLFADTQGVSNWFRSPSGQLPSPDGGTMGVQVGLAWVGHTMIEIIGLTGGNDRLYRQILPDDRFAVRLHHLGYRVHSDAEWDAVYASARKHGFAIAMEVDVKHTRAVYFDTRETLGHYIEYLYYVDEASGSLPHIPQNI